MMLIATCIGCGCDDDRACMSADEQPCAWLRVDRTMGLGVCSGCPEHVNRWDAGDYSLSSLASQDCDDDIGSWEDDGGLILPGDDAFDDTLAGLD